MDYDHLPDKDYSMCSVSYYAERIWTSRGFSTVPWRGPHFIAWRNWYLANHDLSSTKLPSSAVLAISPHEKIVVVMFINEDLGERMVCDVAAFAGPVAARLLKSIRGQEA